MNKKELIEAVTARLDGTKTDTERAITAIFDTIRDGLKDGQQIPIPGFGTFVTSHRAARTGRNPQTGAAIEIGASTVAKFKPAKGLKEALN